MSNRVGRAADAAKFPDAAKRAIGNTQLRHNVRRATDTIRAKRGRVVGELPRLAGTSRRRATPSKIM